MFITVFTYRAKPGQAEAIISLHEEWEAGVPADGAPKASNELLRSLEDREEFVQITRFPDETAARDARGRASYATWFSRLTDLVEAGPVFSHFHTVWQDSLSPAGRPG